MTFMSRVSVKHVMAAVVMTLVVAIAQVAGVDQKFYNDDPIVREPETQDASKAQAWEIILSFDLLQNLFARPGEARDVRAGNVNTIDEVPDSSWFTNRMLTRTMSLEELARGPRTGSGPAPGSWTIAGPKGSGISPGFRLVDSAGVTWFVQFDGRGHLEAATGAAMVANQIFHALGYWQTEYYLTEVRPEALTISPKATIRTPSGRRRPMTRDDVTAVFARAGQQPNGAYRMLASKGLTGRPLGGFRYYGTRPDDPNDLVPHEHRRELRALKVFGAWTNLVDMKAGNTLDFLITDGGRTFVRHYLQDVGSTFGTGALAPREWDEGAEYLFEGSPLWKRLVSFGLVIRPWQTVPYEEHEAIGRFEGDRFDPTAWRPRVPTAAILNARADDNFWAARRVMAFTDEMIRAIVKTGGYTDATAERYLGDVLIKRRDQIGRAYLPAVNPLVGVAIDSTGALTFRNAAVDAGFAAAPAGYRAEWFAFDNTTGNLRPLGGSTPAPTGRMSAPAGLPTTTGAFIRVSVAAEKPAQASWAVPIEVYFRRTSGGWSLVGLERMLSRPADPFPIPKGRAR